MTVLQGEATIRHVAAWVLNEPATQSCIVCVRAGEAAVKAPLFFLGDFAAGGFYVRALAQHFDERVPVYAVHLQPSAPTLERLASSLADAIINVNPQGPLYLAGYCAGATTAVAVAQTLRQRGREVRSVLMIDPPPVRLPAPWLSALVAALFALQQAARNVLAHGPDWWRTLTRAWRAGTLGSLLGAWTQSMLRRAWNWTPVARWRASLHAEPAPQSGATALGKMLRQHRPAVGTERLVLLRCERSMFMGWGDPTLGWGRIGGDVIVRSVKGDHLECVTRYVAELATAMRETLDAV
jgi:thioesterase domain-containing protein